MKYLVALLLLCTNITVQAGPSNDQKAIESVIQKFIHGADEQNVETVSSALHPQAQQFFVQKGELKTLTTELYLKLIEVKKLGGTPRQFEIKKLDINNNIASAQVEIESEKARFHDHISFMKIDNEWKIMNIVLRFEAP